MNISANTVTIVIAICAILSPILVAVINNIYQLVSATFHQLDTTNF